MEYKLLVSDIDGTLVEENNEFDESLVARVDEFRRRGGLFTVATGRTPQSAAAVVGRLGVDLPVIYMNGSLVVDSRTGRTISASYLDSGLTATLLSWLQASGYEGIAFSHEGGFARRLSQHGDAFIHRCNDTCRIVDSWDAAGMNRVNKVMVLSDGSPEEGFRKAFPLLARRVSFVRTGSGIWEVIQRGVSKGAAVKRLAAQLGFGMNRVATVGDQMNDIEMTKMAGMGVAVRNAAPELKQVAGRITGSRCWQGVCELLDEVLLEQPLRKTAFSIPAACVAS
jgi:Cof subfamily protein (haloacid dehalogenase superfamily)